MTITEETAGQFLERVGTNGMLWAEEMHKRFPSVPADDLLGWCCDMIEAGRDVGHRSSQQEVQRLRLFIGQLNDDSHWQALGYDSYREWAREGVKQVRALGEKA